MRYRTEKLLIVSLVHKRADIRAWDPDWNTVLWIAPENRCLVVTQMQTTPWDIHRSSLQRPGGALRSQSTCDIVPSFPNMKHPLYILMLPCQVLYHLHLVHHLRAVHPWYIVSILHKRFIYFNAVRHLFEPMANEGCGIKASIFNNK